MRADSLVFAAQEADNTIQQPRNSGDEAHREARSRDATPSSLPHTLIVSPAEESSWARKAAWSRRWLFCWRALRRQRLPAPRQKQ